MPSRDLDAALLALALGRGLVPAAMLRDCRRELGEAAAPRACLDWLLARGLLDAEALAGLRTEALGTLVPAGEGGAPAPEDLERTWDGEAPKLAASDAFLEGWTRYRGVEFLAEGGMGRVFRAFDPRLRRWVALKFIRHGGTRLAERFREEARAQARVDHPNLAKVFEVGEVQGRPYLAMQLVEGPTLEACAPDLSLEDKVRVLMRAAEGIHAAHRAGLVHRDLKPANILVGRDAEGGPVPYVTDFGLAADPTPEAEAAPGMALGTPHYMAPEQARGTGPLDARTDVWGLGATLYAALTGRPPADGERVGEVLRALQEDDPPPPRSLDPAIPADLETIVLKCLEKEPARRYRSAMALAEDLRRFLEGEPVQAVPPSAAYRLRKALRRHRGLGAVAGAAFLLLGLTLAWGVRGRLRAVERARLLQGWGEEVDRLETGLRFVRLLPQQDLRRVHARAQARTAALEAEARQAGAAEAAEVSYLLGRARMVLGDLDGARVRFEAAWAQGLRGAGLSQAYGLCLARIYARDLPDLERSAFPEEREARRRALDTGCRDRARELLGGLPPAAEDGSALLARAHLAHVQGERTEAFRLLAALTEREPWRMEARVLEARIHLGEGSVLLGSGRQEAALERFGTAEALLRRALGTARSDPDLQEALALAGSLRLEAELQLGRDRGETFAGALAAAQGALAADPERAGAWELASRIQARWADWLLNHGGDWKPVLDGAEADGRKAMDLRPTADALIALAAIQSKQGQGAFRTGRDPRPAWESAAALLRRAEVLEPRRLEAVSALAGIALSQARWSADHGLDGRAQLEEALAASTRVVEAWPRSYDAWYARALARLQAAARLVEEGQDPGKVLDAAGEDLRRALALNPRRAAAHASLGSVARLRLEWDLETGGGAARGGRDLREALAHAEASLAINPAFPNAHMLQGDVRLLEARLGPDRAAALRALDGAEAAYQEARRLNPKLMVAHLGLGTVALRRAERSGNLRSLVAADSALAEARRIREDHWEPCLRLAEVALLRSGPGPEARRWLAAARERNGAAREVLAFEARLGARTGASATPSAAGSRGR
jgi:hypothetical protein